MPVPQTAYYAERSVLEPGTFVGDKHPLDTNWEEFLFALENTPNAKYVLVSFSEPNNPPWMRNEKEEYAQNPQTGQIVRSKWEIPFMNTTIDFLNNREDIKQSMTYGDLTFKLVDIKQDIFIYEVVRG